ncbi:alpha/beta hydrolase family esterase [Brevibacterium marinum]|uniref:Polyhydroxybutyrate depolymerase n=1 Tax=Brevibacterium marinum TaxID=418643 RepID=A0A846RXX3_9MICO|nr:prolyl oligopeptidase family serine peptidase [Brevibacterium marinum]NJC55513.1 polyhydroxybutyrate depolymerase [Brevibacterium marinum]
MPSTTKRRLSIALALTLLLGPTLPLAPQPAASATPTAATSTATSTPTSATPSTAGARDGSPQTEPRLSRGCGVEQKSGNDQGTITSAGDERTYRINIPRDYDATVPTPLILGFHGRGSDGAEFQNYTGLPDLPAITIFPDGVRTDGKRSWQGAPYAGGADDVRFVADLLDSVEDEFCIDLDRVYATGKSNGGGMVSVLACQLRDRFSAFATVAGAYYPQSFAGCDYSEPTPMLAIHGTGDSTMHYEGGERQGETYPSVHEWLQPWAETADCGEPKDRKVGRKGEKVVRTTWQDCRDGADVELYTVAEGGHVWPGETMYSGGGYVTEDFSATETLWDFFSDHSRSNTSTESAGAVGPAGAAGSE